MISHPPRTWQERGGWNFVNPRLQPLRPRGFQIFARLRVLWREFLLLPVDNKAGDKFDANCDIKIVDSDDIPDGWMGMEDRKSVV